MKWYEVLIAIISLMCVINIVYFSLRSMKNTKIYTSISDIVKVVKPNAEIKPHSANMLYNLEILDKKKYMIKVLDINPQNEIIITNSEKVVVNADIKGWKRSTHPKFVPGIKEFIKLSQKRELVKIVLIYPDCHNITKYINESDVYQVDKSKPVDGLYYLRFNELGEFLKKH